MREDWFKTKFINPRNIEGEPQIEQLEYTRELFEKLGEKDERFSGIAILGSAVKGYSHKEDSDIDVMIFYYEESEQEADTLWRATFKKDFSRLKEAFDLEREKNGKKSFKIDTIPGEINLGTDFGIDPVKPNKIPTQKLMKYSPVFYALSHLIIKTKNPNALMSIEKLLDIARKTIAEMSQKEKAQFLERIINFATSMMKNDFAKYYLRTNSSVNEQQYIESRIQMLEKQLKNKFGLAV